jgi:hypothetical protein
LSNTNQEENYIKLLNIIALVTIIVGLSATFLYKKSMYFGIVIIILCITIIIHSRLTMNTKSSFTGIDDISTAFDTGAYLIQNSNLSSSGLNNSINVNQAMYFNVGDVINIIDRSTNLFETNIISDIRYNNTNNTPILILMKNLSHPYTARNTHIMKVSDTTPNVVPPPDGNISIGRKQLPADPHSWGLIRGPNDLPNWDRTDYDLELSTMIPGLPNPYPYQGQPYGNLKCRQSTLNNPMGTINVTEYDAPPTMYGTCNVGEDDNNQKMTSNQEATVSQRVDDLLFHKGNSQFMYSPMPVDTLPDNQTAFANFLYRSPTNLVNPKYASIFVNDPEKFKLVSSLARATGTENGGGGGGGGRP